MVRRRLADDVKALLSELNNNFGAYVNDGALNSEGRKLRGLIIKKLIALFPERKRQIKRFSSAVEEKDVVKLIDLALSLVGGER